MVRKYAKETSYKGETADQALSDAVVLRLGLGQEEEAIADANNFNKYYGGRKPAQAAQIAFAVAAHYGEKSAWEDVVKRLNASMNTIDKQATLDVRIQAHGLLARAYANTKRAPNAATEYKKVLGAWRDPQKAVAEIQSVKDDSEDARTRRIGRTLESVGEATFYFAEEMKSKVDAVKFPEYKGKGSKEEVKKHIETKVKDWIGKKRPLIEAATKRIQEHRRSAASAAASLGNRIRLSCWSDVGSVREGVPRGANSGFNQEGLRATHGVLRGIGRCL